MPTIVVEKEIYEMSGAELDGLPLGVIALDPDGTILYYNSASSVLARQTDEKAGLNFFRDVAPCAAVRDFQGRFLDFVQNVDALCEDFRFIFRFAWGDKEVGIKLVRSPKETDKLFIVVNAYNIDLSVVPAAS
jgi:photoactive yellow protein